jgi:hypothetical protein
MPAPHLHVIRTEGLRILLRVRQRGEQRACFGRMPHLHGVEHRLVVLALRRGRSRLQTQEGDRRRRGGLRGASGAWCARRCGRRIVARRLGVRHRPRNASTAPGTRDRACLGDNTMPAHDRAQTATAHLAPSMPSLGTHAAPTPLARYVACVPSH